MNREDFRHLYRVARVSQTRIETFREGDGIVIERRPEMRESPSVYGKRQNRRGVNLNLRSIRDSIAHLYWLMSTDPEPTVPRRIHVPDRTREVVRSCITTIKRFRSAKEWRPLP